MSTLFARSYYNAGPRIGGKAKAGIQISASLIYRLFQSGQFDGMEKQYLDLPIAQADIAFGLMADFEIDPHPEKVSIIAGAYRDENGQPWVLPSVKKVLGISFYLEKTTKYGEYIGKRTSRRYHPRVFGYSRLPNFHQASKGAYIRAPYIQPQRKFSINPNSFRNRRKSCRSHLPGQPSPP